MTTTTLNVTTIAEQLDSKLSEIVAAVEELLDHSKIDYQRDRALRLSRETRVLVAGLGDGQWGPLDDTQRQLQRRALELWKPWLEQMQLLFSEDTKAAQRKINYAAKNVIAWLERNGRDLMIPPTIAEAKTTFRTMAEPLFESLRSLKTQPSTLLVVPDTNVLIRSPDITSYADVLGTTAYTVLLAPGVLGELDQHKTNHRNPQVRSRAMSMSRRIKGWRNQGDLAKGVRVQGDIFVRVEGREPDFTRTLSWLKAHVVDDQIIATILEAQRQSPNERIVLLSGDDLMRAKADTTNIPVGDTPDADLED